MSTQDSRSISSLDDIEVIIDGDSHVTETMEDITPHLDEKYSGTRYMIERSLNPASEIYTYTRVTPAFMQVEGSECRDPETKLADMDEFGIDSSIITPGLNVGLPTVNNSQAAVALADAYNSWLVEDFLDGSDRLKGQMVVSHQKPHKFAEMIDTYGTEGSIVGVQFPPSGPVPPLGHERYDPIYEAAQDHGLPVALHAGNIDGVSNFPVVRNWNETFAEDHALTFPFAHMWQLTTMLFRGVPERFPDLDFILQESGISWLPYMMWRLDDHYLEMSQELPRVKKPPSEYVRDQFYVTTQPLGLADNPQHLASIIEMIGADNVMFASDHPHPDFDPPEELFTAIRAAFDADDINKIMGRNTKDVYGL